MKNFINKFKENFPLPIFLVGVTLFLLSLWFKAYDMTAVSCIGIFGSFGLGIYGCILDRKMERKIAERMAERKARFEAELEELEREDREKYGIN